ncbi:MAG TPA: molecular chaperone Tir, partial [Nitrospirales bacterium]|nr:molecular chaperone Tir [Nitrospirales bacterium]
MVEYFENVKEFVLDMGYAIAEENPQEQLVVIND